MSRNPTAGGHSRWPFILFATITTVSVVMHFALEAFSTAMGMSSNVPGVIDHTPWFAGVASVVMFIAMCFRGLWKALRAVGYVWAVQVMAGGAINMMVHAAGRCYLGENSSWMDQHPWTTSWMQVGAGAILFTMMILVSVIARRFKMKARIR